MTLDIAPFVLIESHKNNIIISIFEKRHVQLCPQYLIKSIFDIKWDKW